MPVIDSIFENLPVSDNMIHGDKYAFFLKDSETKPAPSYYSYLLSQSTNKICIWDPYFHNYDTSVFNSLKNPVEVTILTKKYNKVKDAYIDSLMLRIETNLSPNIRGDCLFTIGFIDTDRHGRYMWQCHDRFLIIDDTKYFLVGSSISSQINSHNSTGIYFVDSADDKDLIQKVFDATLNQCKMDRMFKTKTL